MNRLETAGLGARLDRLPWGARHTSIMLALGAGWLFGSFEVQLFSTSTRERQSSLRFSEASRARERACMCAVART